MNYEETLDFLYNCYPVFESQGQSAYKPGLYNTERIDQLLGHPHQRYKTIHVAGTNGKGSVSHLIASTLQKSGLKTGLYTSPHIADFGERIRVNGEKIDRRYVIDFVEKHKDELKDIHPSFFEFTMEMAFKYFADEQVDVAVIEVGLGGRLDSTNIITPDLSVITNISLDHTNLLGDTLEQIAAEKAGIIKKGVPVVIGERVSDGVAKVFEDKAKEMGAPIFFAEECFSADKNASNTPVNNSFDVTAKEGNPIGTDSRYINIT
ncbi:MAG: bifunctional folylpolyglutamate synthase/dihydrofolate synthase, partial [Paludibacteraceae bacterium]|nr:bifunctional folylpolyglutamate synthase/dihydrofolate synthase [Paludibacteraceae bacterium]